MSTIPSAQGKAKTPREGGTTNCHKCGAEISQGALCADCWAKSAAEAQPKEPEGVNNPSLRDIEACEKHTGKPWGKAPMNLESAFICGVYHGRSAPAHPGAGSAPDGFVESLVRFPSALHPATRKLVKGFAAALADKLAKSEKKYGYSDGWMETAWIEDGQCRDRLMEHVHKGDPRDVAAYCAFLWYHKASTTPDAMTPNFPTPAPQGQAVEALKLNLPWSVESEYNPDAESSEGGPESVKGFHYFKILDCKGRVIFDSMNRDPVASLIDGDCDETGNNLFDAYAKRDAHALVKLVNALLAPPAAPDAPAGEATRWKDCAEYGWTIIANASGGNWECESKDWQEAAARFRTLYYANLDADRAAMRATQQGAGEGKTP